MLHGIRRLLKRHGAPLLGAVLVTCAALTIPTGYYLVSPGDVRPLSSSVTVQDGVGRTQGEFYLVTVSTRKANAIVHLYGLLDPASKLRPSAEFLPPGIDEEEYYEQTRRMMKESQETAKVVALRRMGYDARLTGSGVRVVSVLPSSPASGILSPGDVIVKVDGQPSPLADELVNIMRKYKPGQELTLEILRDGKSSAVRVAAGRHPEDPARAAIGVQIETFDWRAVVPVSVQIDTGSISGPSAGLMLALEIIEQVNRGGSLLHGKRIAGTGTISPGGEVGPVGGVAQKTIAAERSGVKAFLVPRENAEEAQAVARRMAVVPVGSLDEAIDYLIREGGSLRPALP